MREYMTAYICLTIHLNFIAPQPNYNSATSNPQLNTKRSKIRCGAKKISATPIYTPLLRTIALKRFHSD